MAVSPQRKETIWHRDNFICFYCKVNLRKHFKPKEERDSNYIITVDHIIARSLGGQNEESNMVTCCRDCNQRKCVKEQVRIYKK